MELLYLCLYLTKGTIFYKNALGNKMCVPCFSATFLEILFFLRNERDIIENVYRSSCKVAVILIRF